MCSTLTVRPEVLKAILGNDPAKVGALTARWLALGSGLQLLLSPTLGKLSDSIGRKPVLIGTAVATLLLRVAVALNPTNMSVLMAERIIPQAINYYSQWAIANAAFADLCSSTEELATTFSKCGTPAGQGGQRDNMPGIAQTRSAPPRPGAPNAAATRPALSGPGGVSSNARSPLWHPAPASANAGRHQRRAPPFADSCRGLGSGCSFRRWWRQVLPR